MIQATATVYGNCKLKHILLQTVHPPGRSGDYICDVAQHIHFPIIKADDDHLFFIPIVDLAISI